MGLTVVNHGVGFARSYPRPIGAQDMVCEVMEVATNAATTADIYGIGNTNWSAEAGATYITNFIAAFPRSNLQAEEPPQVTIATSDGQANSKLTLTTDTSGDTFDVLVFGYVQG